MMDAPPHIQELPRLEDADFLFDGYTGEGVQQFHDAAIALFTELDDYTGSDTRYFILGNYESAEKREAPKDRLTAVRDKINEDILDARAFLLDDLDETNEQWANFYLKFRYTLIGTDYVLLVAEDNDGGHELELGEVPLADTYVFKRDYRDVSIDSDIEYEKFDAMIATLFEMMAENNRLTRWTTTDELLESVKETVDETL